MKTYLKNRGALFAQPAFFRYFLGGILATLGFGIGYIGTTWLLLSLDNSLSALIWGFLAYWVPNALCSPLAGVIVDRFDRKKLIGIGDILCGITYAALGVILFFVPNVSIYWVYFIWAIIGILQGFYTPALMAFIREVVSKDDLLYANANVDLGYQIGWIVGAGLAGFVIHLLGFYLSYLLVGAILVFAGLTILSVKRVGKKKRAITKEDKKSKKIGIFRQVGLDFKSGMKYLFSNKQALVVYFAQLFFILIFMTAPVLLAPFAKNILHANAAEFGQIEATLTIGMVVGGIVITYLAEKVGFNKIVLWCTSMLVISILGFSMVSTLFLGAVAYLFLGFSLGCWALLMTKAQEVTDLDYQGRVQSVFSCLLALGIIILYLGIHLASGLINIRHIYWIVGVLAIVPIALVLIFPKYFSE